MGAEASPPSKNFTINLLAREIVEGDMFWTEIGYGHNEGPLALLFFFSCPLNKKIKATCSTDAVTYTGNENI